jgi:prepilin-type N-terminal cleavage/methylation domain-containing protein/prepilin-type processing-associated H-X9-DG protein
MKTGNKGFTLIELLVVIAIVVLLVSIMMPALNSAREQAKLAVCTAQLSGIGKAVLQYVNDNKNELPSPGAYRSENARKGDPVLPDFFIPFDKQTACNYFTYLDYPGFDRGEDLGAGPCEFGCLFVTGQLPNNSDIIFCPSYRNPVFGNYIGQRKAAASDSRNARGDVLHENYIGANSAKNRFLIPEDQKKVNWVNGQAGYGFRPLFGLGITSFLRTKSSMSYISDVWEAVGGFNQIHIDELSHCAKRGSDVSDIKGGVMATINAWYFDGHVNSKSYPKKYFLATGMSSYTGFMNTDLTWEVLFEGGI